MTNQVIDNSIENLGKVVLWQYDRAIRLLSIMKHMQVLYHCAVEQFWDYWRTRVLSIDTCSLFGTSVYALLLGVPRPLVTSGSGEKHPVAVSVFRKILKGAFFLMRSSGSFSDMARYVNIVFAVDGKNNLSRWVGTTNAEGWETNEDELNDETENPTSDTLILKLIDPNGVVRAVGGNSLDSLEITASYKVGMHTIVATAKREQKSGVEVVDKGGMSIAFKNSQYFDEMHEDQKALFEQHFNEFLPSPIGVSKNGPAEEWVWGFPGQENEQYESGKAYTKGHIFGYVDAEGHGFNWKCLKDISASQNSSFKAIEGMIEKTEDGDPFVSIPSNAILPYRANRVSGGGTGDMGTTLNVDQLFVYTGGALPQIRSAGATTSKAYDAGIYSNAIGQEYNIYTSGAWGGSSNTTALLLPILALGGLVGEGSNYNSQNEVKPKAEVGRDQAMSFLNDVFYAKGSKVKYNQEEYVFLQDGKYRTIASFLANVQKEIKTTLICSTTRERLLN